MCTEQIVKMLWFLLIILVFMCGWGVAQHSLLYPLWPASLGLVRDVLFLPYWYSYIYYYLKIRVKIIHTCQ